MSFLYLSTDWWDARAVAAGQDCWRPARRVLGLPMGLSHVIGLTQCFRRRVRESGLRSAVQCVPLGKTSLSACGQVLDGHGANWGSAQHLGVPHDGRPARLCRRVSHRPDPIGAATFSTATRTTWAEYCRTRVGDCDWPKHSHSAGIPRDRDHYSRVHRPHTISAAQPSSVWPLPRTVVESCDPM